MVLWESPTGPPNSKQKTANLNPFFAPYGLELISDLQEELVECAGSGEKPVLVATVSAFREQWAGTSKPIHRGDRIDLLTSISNRKELACTGLSRALRIEWASILPGQVAIHSEDTLRAAS